MINQSPQPANPTSDVLDVISEILPDQLEEVLLYAKALHASQLLELDADETPHRLDWEAAPLSVRLLVGHLYDAWRANLSV